MFAMHCSRRNSVGAASCSAAACMALLIAALLLLQPSCASVVVRKLNLNATPSPELTCTREVLGGTSLLDGWALKDITYGMSLIANGAASPLDDASLQQPAQVVYKGCFRTGLFSIITALNASSALRGPREVDAISIDGIRRYDSAAVVDACIAACMSIGRYRTTRDVLVHLPQGETDVNDYGDPQMLCICVPKDGIDELSTVPNPNYSVEGCGIVRSVAVFHVNLYCAARGVEGIVCNSGCQLRGLTGCCYPGTYVPPLQPENAADAEDDGDEALASLLQWAVIGVVAFGIAQGGLCWLVQCLVFRYKDQRMNKQRRDRNLGSTPDTAPPRSEAESDLLASTLLTQRYGWEHAADDDDDGEEMLFLYSELKRHTSETPLAQTTPTSSAGGLLPPLPNASMVEGSGEMPMAFTLDHEDDAIFHELFGVPPSASLHRSFNNTSVALSAAAGGCDGTEIGQQLCPICLESISQVSTKSSYTIVSLECRHKAHRHCLRQYFSHRVRFREALRCPVFGCDQQVEF